MQAIKQSLKARFPELATVAKAVMTSLERKPQIKDTFYHIYKTNGFGGRESVSGEGSSLEQTVVLRKALPSLLDSIQATTMLDAPCGDYFWMKELSLDLESYIGADIVREIIEQNHRKYGGPRKQFIVKDITKDRLPSVDCILCRDCLDHLSFEHAFRALQNFRRSGAKYLLTTTYTARTQNEDIMTGGFRPTNLQLPPFSFPPPIQLINEQCTEEGSKWSDKSLGLWRINDLPSFTTDARRFLMHNH
jgi:hypothetical protein